MVLETQLFCHADFLMENLLWMVITIIHSQGGAISLKNASVPTARLINPRELEYASFACHSFSIYFY
jgi:hypothetical protein